MNECTLDTCAQPTDLNLCSDCTRDLQAILDKIPALVTVLDLIGRRTEAPFTVKSTNRPVGKPRPTTPLNLTAVALATKLRMAYQRTANDYAHDEDAAWKFEHIEQSVRDADRMVNGEDEGVPTEEYLDARMKEVLPMTAAELEPWLKEKFNLDISAGRIQKWHARDKLQRSNVSGHPTYHPRDVLKAHAKSRSKK